MLICLPRWRASGSTTGPHQIQRLSVEGQNISDAAQWRLSADFVVSSPFNWTGGSEELRNALVSVYGGSTSDFMFLDNLGAETTNPAYNVGYNGSVYSGYVDIVFKGIFAGVNQTLVKLTNVSTGDQVASQQVSAELNAIRQVFRLSVEGQNITDSTQWVLSADGNDSSPFLWTGGSGELRGALGSIYETSGNNFLFLDHLGAETTNPAYNVGWDGSNYSGYVDIVVARQLSGTNLTLPTLSNVSTGSQLAVQQRAGELVPV